MRRTNASLLMCDEYFQHNIMYSCVDLFEEKKNISDQISRLDDEEKVFWLDMADYQVRIHNLDFINE